MKDSLFDTKEKIEAAIAALTSLLTHPGWLLIEKIQDIYIKVARERLEVGLGKEETKADIDNTRVMLKMFKNFKNTPQDMIKKLESPEEEVPRIDPFDTVEDLQKRRETGQEE